MDHRFVCLQVTFISMIHHSNYLPFLFASKISNKIDEVIYPIPMLSLKSLNEYGWNIINGRPYLFRESNTGQLYV